MRVLIIENKCLTSCDPVAILIVDAMSTERAAPVSRMADSVSCIVNASGGGWRVFEATFR